MIAPSRWLRLLKWLQGYRFERGVVVTWDPRHGTPLGSPRNPTVRSTESWRWVKR